MISSSFLKPSLGSYMYNIMSSATSDSLTSSFPVRIPFTLFSFLIPVVRTIMASCPMTSWQIDGETLEIVSCFTLGGPKITADGDCSREIKRHLLLGRKVTTNLDSILKNRAITLPTKVRLVKSMVFPGVMYGCESWTVKKADC